MTTWRRITVSLLSAFLFLQVSGQFGVFTGGVNTYSVVASFDIYTHALGAAVLGAFLLQYVTLPCKCDPLWRVWIPFQVAVVGTVWEIVELIITWFGLMPPEQMFATIENSVRDIFVDFLGVCTISFLYELMEEKQHRVVRCASVVPAGEGRITLGLLMRNDQ